MSRALTTLYQILVLLSVIATLYHSYKYVTDEKEYDLALYLTEQNKVIENNTGLADLKIIYKNSVVDSLYSTKLLLKNSGKKAITKDFVFEPFIVKIQDPNSILLLRSDSQSVKFKNNVITIEFDLLNPGEEISFLLLTSKDPKFNFWYKIKEIKNINFIDYVNNPPAKDRLYSVNIFWFILLLTSIFISLDAVFLLKEDIKLAEIFALIRAIPGDSNFDKQSTLEALSCLYGAYVDALPFVFTSKERLIKSMSSKMDSLDTTNERDRYILYQHAINLVRHGNLYSTRSIGIIAGPILLIICVISIDVSIFA